MLLTSYRSVTKRRTGLWGGHKESHIGDGAVETLLDEHIDLFIARVEKEYKKP